MATLSFSFFDLRSTETFARKAIFIDGVYEVFVNQDDETVRVVSYDCAAHKVSALATDWNGVKF